MEDPCAMLKASASSGQKTFKMLVIRTLGVMALLMKSCERMTENVNHPNACSRVLNQFGSSKKVQYMAWYVRALFGVESN